MQIQGFKIPKAVLDYVSYGDREHGEEWLETKLREVHREFEELVTWLPASDGGGVLDIGCGLAAIDVMLARALLLRSIHLLDGEADRPQERVKFRPGGTQAWNDVRIGGLLVSENLPPAEEPATVNTYTDPAKIFINVGLVISLKSWCHHYPASTYLPLVRRSLARGGVLIVDIRKGTSGREELEAAGFEWRGRAGGTEKCDRYIFYRR